MLASTHALVGAVIGISSKNNTQAVTYGVASHFILDSIPHWGGVGSYETFLKVAVPDGLTVLALTALVYKKTPSHIRNRTLLGLVGAVFPDLDKPSVLFFKRNPFPKKIQKFHESIQTEKPILVVVDTTFFIISGVLLYSILKKNVQ